MYVEPAGGSIVMRKRISSRPLRRSARWPDAPSATLNATLPGPVDARETRPTSTSAVLAPPESALRVASARASRREPALRTFTVPRTAVPRWRSATVSLVAAGRAGGRSRRWRRHPGRRRWGGAGGRWRGTGRRRAAGAQPGRSP